MKTKSRSISRTTPGSFPVQPGKLRIALAAAPAFASSERDLACGGGPVRIRPPQSGRPRAAHLGGRHAPIRSGLVRPTLLRTHPAKLLAQGVDYSNASTPFPSDSFPGMVGQVTGGDPRVTGIYYDDTWNHAVFPATGTTNATGPAPGGEVTYFEALDLNLGAPGRRPGHRAGAGFGPLGEYSADDRQSAEGHQPGTIARRCGHRPADLSQSIPEGEHDFRGGPSTWAVDRVVGQAPRLSNFVRTFRPRSRRLFHARDQQQFERDRPDGSHPTGLDHGQPRDAAVRQL